jgi:hypothetical protein
LKHTTSYSHWRNDPSEWVIAEGAHESIISPELWKKASSQRRPVTQRAPKAAAHTSDFLLMSLARCFKCSFSFEGWTGRGKGNVYRKYIDSGWNSKQVCEFLGIPKEKLEKSLSIPSGKSCLRYLRNRESKSDLNCC